jgi:protein SCO1/2
MPAMTMNFDVGDEALLETLAPGQRIEFELEYGEKGYRILSATVVGTGAGSRGARLGLQGAARDEQPAPDFALVDQDGEPLALEDLRGRVLLVDFVYTHCPGPCPILTGLHVEALRALPDAVRDRVHFVSISLDPERDTPDALRRYAEARGADDPHWSFLTGEPEVVADVLARWGVGSMPGENGEIEHLVASFLVDPQGVIVKRYLGLDHEPAEIASDLEKAAS